MQIFTDFLAYFLSCTSILYFLIVFFNKFICCDKTTGQSCTFGQSADIINSWLIKKLKEWISRYNMPPFWGIYPGKDCTSYNVVPADVEKVFSDLLANFDSGHLCDYGYIDGCSNLCQYNFVVGNFIKDMPDLPTRTSYLENLCEDCVVHFAHTLYPRGKFIGISTFYYSGSNLVVYIAQNQLGVDCLKAYRDNRYIQQAEQAAAKNNADDIEV